MQLYLRMMSYCGATQSNQAYELRNRQNGMSKNDKGIQKEAHKLIAYKRAVKIQKYSELVVP